MPYKDYSKASALFGYILDSIGIKERLASIVDIDIDIAIAIVGFGSSTLLSCSLSKIRRTRSSRFSIV